MTTLPELIAQQAALAAQIAEHERPLVQDAYDILTGQPVTGVAEMLTVLKNQLPEGMAKTHIGNVLTVLNAVPQVLTQELARLNPPGVTAPMMPQ